MARLSDVLDGNTWIACVDIEATCDNDESFDRSSMEIIEFGLTLLNHEYKVVGTFNSFVRPTVNPTLTQFCKELTTITQDQVDTAPTWTEVAKQLEQFFIDSCAHEDPAPSLIWVSWGDFDKNKIAKESAKLGIADPMPTRHFNLKFLEAAHRNTKKQEGLSKTINRLGLKFPGQLHRACDDAAAVGLVLAELAPGLIRSKL